VTIDPYLDPAAGVLRNRLDISDEATLRVVEADITAAIMLRLSEQALPGAYDLTHLRSFHREIFGDVYPWAGEIRTVAIAKTDLFCLPQHIEPYAAEVLGQLADESTCATCRGTGS
jgi:cell filamentation protein